MLKLLTLTVTALAGILGNSSGTFGHQRGTFGQLKTRLWIGPAGSPVCHF